MSEAPPGSSPAFTPCKTEGLAGSCLPSSGLLSGPERCSAGAQAQRCPRGRHPGVGASCHQEFHLRVCVASIAFCLFKAVHGVLSLALSGCCGSTGPPCPPSPTWKPGLCTVFWVLPPSDTLSPDSTSASPGPGVPSPRAPEKSHLPAYEALPRPDYLAGRRTWAQNFQGWLPPPAGLIVFSP